MQLFCNIPIVDHVTSHDVDGYRYVQTTAYSMRMVIVRAHRPQVVGVSVDTNITGMAKSMIIYQ